jgi:SAM-dependent methyltransferase
MEELRPEGAMEDEFDTLPLWTAEAVLELGPEHAVPAACRGSGSPEALRWLCRSMGLRAGIRLLDSGAGEGGPAALAAREFGVSSVLVDPLYGACVAARQMFHQPTVVAGGEQLPFPDGTFDAAWSLGVLCTVTDKASVLKELRRVVRPGAKVAVLVFVRTVDVLPEQPDGNHFPDQAELESLMSAAHLGVTQRATLAQFPDPPPEWQAKVDAVDRTIQRRHQHDRRLAAAQEQQRTIGQLLADGLVEGQLLLGPAF